MKAYSFDTCCRAHLGYKLGIFTGMDNNNPIHKSRYYPTLPWWRHDVKNFPASLALCEKNLTNNGDSTTKSQWWDLRCFLCCLHEQSVEKKQSNFLGKINHYHYHCWIANMLIDAMAPIRRSSTLSQYWIIVDKSDWNLIRNTVEPLWKVRNVTLRLQNLVHFRAPFFTNHVYFTPLDRPPLLKGHIGWPL